MEFSDSWVEICIQFKNVKNDTTSYINHPVISQHENLHAQCKTPPALPELQKCDPASLTKHHNWIVNEAKVVVVL